MKINEFMCRLFLFILLQQCQSVFAEDISSFLLNRNTPVENVGLSESLLGLSVPQPQGSNTDISKDNGKPKKKSNVTSSYGKVLDKAQNTLSNNIGRLPASQVYTIDNQKAARKFPSPSYGNGNLWRVERGENLFNVLSQWSGDAGWSLLWKVGGSYRVLSSATFSGDFISAVKQLFSAMGMQNINIYIKFYTGNKVLLVTSEL